jgi:hypothetical protein
VIVKAIGAWGVVAMVITLNFITYAVFGPGFIYLSMSCIWAGLGIIILHRVIK